VASDGFSLFSQPIQAIKPAMKPDGNSRKHTKGSDSVLTYKLKLRKKWYLQRSIRGVSKEYPRYQSTKIGCTAPPPRLPWLLQLLHIMLVLKASHLTQFMAILI
jgi:hypothetical protein